MPRGNVDEMIRKEEDRKAQATARLHRLKARKSQEARKRETRLVILTGRMTLDRVQRGELSQRQYLADMERYLTRDRDRALLDLPPRPTKED